MMFAGTVGQTGTMGQTVETMETAGQTVADNILTIKKKSFQPTCILAEAFMRTI